MSLSLSLYTSFAVLARSAAGVGLSLLLAFNVVGCQTCSSFGAARVRFCCCCCRRRCCSCCCCYCCRCRCCCCRLLLPAAVTLCVLHVVALPYPPYRPAPATAPAPAAKQQQQTCRGRVCLLRLGYLTVPQPQPVCMRPCECVASSLLSMCIQYYYDVPLALALSVSVCVREC